MRKKIRPLAPHLLVYKPQLTSIFSIFHRISAGILFVVFTILLFLSYCFDYYLNFFSFYFIFYYFFPFFNLIIYFVSYFLTFIFLFHMVNGLRHISWDFGLGLEIKNVYITGIIVFCISSLFVFVLILI
uniref:Succinate:cytochrome c oxidoreductase subunit 3 n=1 Tax=Rhodomonas salina TaxID=3034 RepID=Q9G8V4_RHDSA|nr:succinate:cytochrome c oxidoreductase subunit 3 [Rhodomonas salina]AAG17743.1 succinate:cytochrome c oxidoreductase subunit 3 [Rhodomonas salina]